MSLFSFDQEQLMTFFAVLVRYSVLIAILPFVGDRFVPGPVKVLLALAITFVAFPMLSHRGLINSGDAIAWGSNAGGIIRVIGLEALFGLILGFSARFVFDSLTFGANMIGTFMGFAAASQFDPHMETQSQVIAEFYIAVAMLLFLVLDGHHLMLRAALDSYRFVGLGQISIGPAFSQKLVELSGEVMRFGIQIAAPVAVSTFTVNVVFGVLSKAMPQLNVLILSFAVTGMVGLVAMFVGLSEFQGAASSILGRVGEWMQTIALSLNGK